MKYVILILLAVALCIGAMVWGAVEMKRWSCSARWQDFDTQFTVIGGCQVKVNGRWIPSANFRQF